MIVLQVYLRWFRPSGEILEWSYPATDQRLAEKRLRKRQRILGIISPGTRCELCHRSNNPHIYNHAWMD